MEFETSDLPKNIKDFILTTINNINRPNHESFSYSSQNLDQNHISIEEFKEIVDLRLTDDHLCSLAIKNSSDNGSSLLLLQKLCWKEEKSDQELNFLEETMRALKTLRPERKQNSEGKSCKTPPTKREEFLKFLRAAVRSLKVFDCEVKLTNPNKFLMFNSIGKRIAECFFADKSCSNTSDEEILCCHKSRCSDKNIATNNKAASSSADIRTVELFSTYGNVLSFIIVIKRKHMMYLIISDIELLIRSIVREKYRKFEYHVRKGQKIQEERAVMFLEASDDPSTSKTKPCVFNIGSSTTNHLGRTRIVNNYYTGSPEQHHSSSMASSRLPYTHSLVRNLL
jgi:hypothetical protein